MALQRLESELKHSHVTSDRKERDFSLALQSRDEALRDAEKLRAQVDAAEERQRQHVSCDHGRWKTGHLEHAPRLGGLLFEM